MFGKTKEHSDKTGDDAVEAHDLAVEQFFGDEQAAADAVVAEGLHRRVMQVESQISSQFTSMAAYAQIAQEQIETARSEAKNATERSERRVIELIERERADRLASQAELSAGVSEAGSVPADAARLDALDRAVSELRHGLNDCLARQKALADAITALFEPVRTSKAAGTSSMSTLPPPTLDGPVGGPISDLSLV